MGNCCGGKPMEYTKEHIKNIVKVQGAIRTFRARMQLRQAREHKINTLFGRVDLALLVGDIGINGASEQGRHISSPLKNGSMNAKRDIYSQHIEQMPPFHLSVSDLVKGDGIERVYIDEFKEIGDGKLFKGEWNKKIGERDGVGIQFWPDGSKYEGMWRRNKAHGRGRMTHANGDIYEGNWVQDKASGFGVFIDTNNAQYQGEWVEDLQHGQGIETWDNGAAKYIGQFYKGKKSGKGRFEWEDGSYYDGDFIDGQFQGQGKYFFADLDKIYQGEFRLSNMEGRGIEQWKDGRKFDGDFKGGKKDGEGTFEWPNGNKYIGSWKKGKQHGNGVWFSAQEGSKRQGEWQNGKRARWISGLEVTTTSPSRPHA